MLTLNIAKRLAHHSSMGKNFTNRLKSTSKPETTTNQSFATSNKERWSASKATSAEPALLEPVHIGARVQGMDGTDWGTIVGEKTEAWKLDLDDKIATQKTMGVKWNVVQEPTPTARVESRVVSGEDLGTSVEQPPQSSWELNELGTTGGKATRDEEVSNLDNSVRSFTDYKNWIRKQKNFDGTSVCSSLRAGRKKRQRQKKRPSQLDKAIRQEFPTFPTNQKERDHQESRRKALRSEIHYFNSNSTSMQAGLQAQKKRIQVRQELEQAKIASTKHFNKQREPNANQHTTTTQPIQLIQPNKKEDLSFLYRKPSQTKKKLEILTKPTVAEVVVATVAPVSPRAPKKLENMKVSELKQKANKLGLSKEQVIELAGGSNRRNEYNQLIGELGRVLTGKQTRLLWINGIKEYLKNQAAATPNRIELSEMLTVEDCNVMIAACSTSEQQWELIDVTMRNANIKPTVSTFNTHIERLMIEGSYLEAKIVIEEMKAVGIEPDAGSTEILSWSESDLSNRRNGQLRQFWLEGGQKATDAAWKLFNCIVERDLANVSTFNSMLIFCQNYDQQRELIDVKMVQARIQPDVSTWHKLLIDKLLRKDKGTFDKDRTRRTMARADKLAGRGHANKLESLLKTDGKEASMKYLQEMIHNGKANTIDCGWALKELCDTSDEARDVIHQMDKNNVPMNEVILTQLINQLLYDDKQEEAQHVFDNEFERYGLKPNNRTRTTMAAADKLASIGHTNKMKSILRADGKEATMKYLIESMHNGKASTTNCGWAMKELCDTSDEARAVIHQMNENNVPITEVILTHLIYQLLHEDKKEEAQYVFDNDFKRYGVQPDHITRETMENFNYGITLAYPFDEFLSLASTNAATWRNKLKEMV